MAIRVLVTGAAGYIGSILCEYLVSQLYHVTALDSFIYDQTPLNHLCSEGVFNIVRGDCRDTGLMKELVAGQDFIIPLAAIVGAPACSRDPWAAKEVNLDSIISLCHLADENQKIIIPITNSGYGIGKKNKLCTEESPLNPVSDYGRWKVTAEQIVLGRRNAISLRLATVFGMSPRMRVDLLVNDFVWRAVKDRSIVLFEPNFKRNYIHVRDVARAFLHCIDNFDDMKNQAYNIGLSDANLSKMELAQTIRKFLPETEIIVAEHGKDPDKRDYIVSNEKIERSGFRPMFSLSDGIEELIKGYRQIRNLGYANS